MEIRLATAADADAIWAILEPTIRAGETYALPREMTRDAALAWWHAPSNETYVSIESPGFAGARSDAQRRGESIESPGFAGARSDAQRRGESIDDGVVGTYFVRRNQLGGGAHVANCAYVTATGMTGRGVARAMCAHSIERARERGFRAMQFNFVVSTNERAVRLWESMGFAIAGRLAGAFAHPTLGDVDALVMYRRL